MVTRLFVKAYMAITCVKRHIIHFIVRNTIIKTINFVSKQRRHLISSQKRLTISNLIKCFTIWKDVQKSIFVMAFNFFITYNII